MRTRRWFRWRLLLLFVVVGPLLGAVPALLFLGAGDGSVWTVDALLLMLPLIYIFGSLPALLTGLLFPWTARLLPGRARTGAWMELLLAAAMGPLVTSALMMALGLFKSSVVFFAVLAALAAPACVCLDRMLDLTFARRRLPQRGDGGDSPRA